VTPEDRAGRIASLKQELLSHHEHRRKVETDPELTAKERAKRLRDHDRLILRLLDQHVVLEAEKQEPLRIAKHLNGYSRTTTKYE